MGIDYAEIKGSMEFREALHVIKCWTGLTLSNIELVILKHLVNDAVKRSENSKESKTNAFEPAKDAVVLFLRDYYDCDIQRQIDLHILYDTRRNLHEKRGYDALAEYFALKQDKAHMP